MATNGEISESTEKTKSIRFTVSQVETEEVVIKPGWRPSGLYDLQEGTVGRSSLGYTTLNTQEAYPNTLYYRDQDSSQVLYVRVVVWLLRLKLRYYTGFMGISVLFRFGGTCMGIAVFYRCYLFLL